jgi:hypothetical protein
METTQIRITSNVADLRRTGGNDYADRFNGETIEAEIHADGWAYGAGHKFPPDLFTETVKPMNIAIPALRPAPNMPMGAMLAGNLTLQTIPSAYMNGADFAAQEIGRELYTLAKNGDLAALVSAIREVSEGQYTINSKRRPQ